MKRTIFLAASLLLSGLAFAQLQAGRIIYEKISKTQVNIMAGNVDAETKKQIPVSRKETTELLFGNNQAVLRTLPDAGAEADQMNGEAKQMQFMKMPGGGSEDNVFFDFSTGTKASAAELNSKKYVIEDTLAKLEWKITGETKQILGYTAIKATADTKAKKGITTMENGQMKLKETEETIPVVAWFTKEIPVAGGPTYQGQLPGMILSLDMGNGKAVYNAVEVSPKVNLASIKEPKGGKKISRVEYAKLQKIALDERTKYLQDNLGKEVKMETKQ